jgi:hypothetical protein
MQFYLHFLVDAGGRKATPSEQRIEPLDMDVLPPSLPRDQRIGTYQPTAFAKSTQLLDVIISNSTK